MASDGFRINRADYKPRFSDHLTPGRHLARIFDVEPGTTGSGHSKIVVRSSIVGGADDGGILVDHVPTSGPAVFRSVNLMRALGIKLDRDDFSNKEVIGRTYVVNLKDGEPFGDEGIIKSEIVDVYPSATWKGYPNESVETPQRSEGVEAVAVAEVEGQLALDEGAIDSFETDDSISL